MNKSAKEMFEELGYKREHHIAYIKYTKDTALIDDCTDFVFFEQETEEIEVRFNIDMPLLKAINKQIEELGWNDEI